MTAPTGLVDGLGAEHAEHRGGEQGCRRPFARDVADDEAEVAVRHIDVVEEIAADRSAGLGCGNAREERPV